MKVTLYGIPGPTIDGQSAGALARRVLARSPGRIGPVCPDGWLRPLRAPAAA